MISATHAPNPGRELAGSRIPRGIQSVRLDADGIPGAVNTLTTAQEHLFFGPQVAVDSRHRPTVVWSSVGGPIQMTRGHDRR